MLRRNSTYEWLFHHVRETEKSLVCRVAAHCHPQEKQIKIREKAGKLFVGLTLLALSGFFVYGALSADEKPGKNELPLDELRIFSEIFAWIKSDYVKDVENKELIENAIIGMLGRLDPYSAYLKKKEFDDLKTSTSGKFGGLGIEIGMFRGAVRIISPVDDTPAYRAGLQPGDLIIQIDDKPVEGMTLMEAVELMRGEPKSTVTLTIFRNKTPPFPVTLERAIIKIQSVKTLMLAPGYAYVRINNFQSNTGGVLRNKIRKLKREAGELKGLVLDLRNNPGGLLGAAIKVSDMFLKPGVSVVYTQGRKPDSRREYRTVDGDELPGVDVVVLINGGSASASEIVAGALQDHGRAKIMGEQSFGKASVQTIHALTTDSALKLTTAMYYTPKDRMIHGVGIKPDILFAKEPQQKATKTETVESVSEEAVFKSWETRILEDRQVQQALDELMHTVAQK